MYPTKKSISTHYNKERICCCKNQQPNYSPTCPTPNTHFILPSLSYNQKLPNITQYNLFICISTIVPIKHVPLPSKFVGFLVCCLMICRPIFAQHQLAAFHPTCTPVVPIAIVKLDLV